MDIPITPGQSGSENKIMLQKDGLDQRLLTSVVSPECLPAEEAAC